MSVIVPVYSEQTLTRDAQEIIEQVLEDFPPNTFTFVDVTTKMQGPPPYHRTNWSQGSPKVLVLGSDKLFGVPFSAPWELIRTYSVAQLCTKANAASALKAALNQFYLPQKQHPAVLNHVGIMDFDFDKPIAVDIETSGNLDTETPEQVGILSIAFYQEGKWSIVSFRGRETHTNFLISVYNILEKIKYPIWHNGKFDIRVIEAQVGIRMPNYFDTMLAHHVLNMAAGLHALKPLCRMYLGAPEWEVDLKKYTKKGGYYENVPAHILNEYNMWDVYWTYELWKYLEPQILADENNMKAFMVEMAASEFLMEVEQKGFAVDESYLLSLSSSMQNDLTKQKAHLVTMTGNPSFNPGSWQQVQKFISQILNATYSGSTDEKHLLELRSTQGPNHPMLVAFIDSLLEYRGTAKALATYVQGALNAAYNRRVHTTFKIHGTSTGRLSSANPNIQNIPRDKKYRSIYVG